MNTETTRRVLTVEEAARILGISRSACYRAVHAGELPSLSLGRRLVIPRVRLLELLGEPLREGGA